MYLPNEPVYFLGFFTSWIRIRVQEAYLYADPCGSGSETLPWIRIHMDIFGILNPDPDPHEILCGSETLIYIGSVVSGTLATGI